MKLVMVICCALALGACGERAAKMSEKVLVDQKGTNGDSGFDPQSVLASIRFKEDFETVRVYFGTNRARDPRDGSVIPYGSRRGDRTLYGWCDITIPLKGRDPGDIPRPFFESSRGNSRDHFVIAGAAEQDEAGFFSGLQKRVAEKGSDAVLVFVHGYNVSFAAAAYRTAQIAFDLKFPGPALFFSWPAVGHVQAYATDYDSVHLAKPHLTRFLEQTAERTGDKPIFLIAHSMGNQALPQAVIDLLTRRPELRPRFKELILAAPDIDAAEFRTSIAPFFREAKIGVTLYASRNDRALAASRTIRSGYPRAGDLHDGPVVERSVETIDASDVETDFLLEHSYFAESESILSDMYYLVKKGLRAPDRFGLQEVPFMDARYWRIIAKRQFWSMVLYASLAIAALAGLFYFLYRRKRPSA